MCCTSVLSTKIEELLVFTKHHRKIIQTGLTRFCSVRPEIEFYWTQFRSFNSLIVLIEITDESGQEVLKK